MTGSGDTAERAAKAANASGPLSNFQINSKMRDVKGFLGCYAHNQLASLGNPIRGQSLIMNLENIGQSGSHWVAMYFGDHPGGPLCGAAEYFDSFGLAPDDRSMTYLGKYGKNIMYNREKLQLDSSQECGYYSMSFIRCRVSGLTMLQSINEFRNYPGTYNEKLALELSK
jgi:hypothetical protein